MAALNLAFRIVKMEHYQLYDYDKQNLDDPTDIRFKSLDHPFFIASIEANPDFDKEQFDLQNNSQTVFETKNLSVIEFRELQAKRTNDFREWIYNTAKELCDKYCIENNISDFNNVPTKDKYTFCIIDDLRRFLFIQVPAIYEVQYRQGYHNYFNQFKTDSCKPQFHLNTQPGIELDIKSFSKDELENITENSEGLYNFPSFYNKKRPITLPSEAHRHIAKRTIQDRQIESSKRREQRAILNETIAQRKSEYQKAYLDWVAECQNLKTQKESERRPLIEYREWLNSEYAKNTRQLQEIELRYKAPRMPSKSDFLNE